MVKRTSKLLFLIVLFLLSFTFSACVITTGGDGQEYSIIYINGSNVIDLEPRTYISGNLTKLPSLGDDFVGWYTNKELSGEAVNEIKTNSVGHLIFYTDYNLANEKYYTVIFKDYNDVILKEESVKEGSSATAPNNPKREGYVFISWSESFSNVSKDLVIYAQYELIETKNDKSILDCFKKTFEDCNNFKLIYSYVEDNDYDYIETYIYSDNGIKYTYIDYYEDECTDYIYVNEDDLLVYLYDNGDGTYEEYLEGSLDFEELYAYVYVTYYEDIEDEYFEYSNNCFVAKSNKANEVGKALLGDYTGETYTSVKVYINDSSYVTKIVAESTLNYEGEIYSYDYEILLSNFNNVSVNIPNSNNSNIKEEVSISSSTNIYTVVKGTNLQDVLHDAYIVLNYSDGTSVLLDNSDCTFNSTYNKNVVGTYEVNVQYNDFTCKFNIVVIEESQSDKTIEDYVNAMTNYKYVYSYNDPIEGAYSSTNYSNNSIYKFEINEDGEVYYDYVYYDNSGSPVYLYDYGDGTYETLTESDYYFEDYYYYVDIIDLSVLNSNDFTFSNNCFVAKASVVDDVTFNLMSGYDGETYTSLKIYVNGTYISKIEAVSSYEYNSKNYTCTYKIEFSNVGSTNITLPNGTGNVDPIEKEVVGIKSSATNINVVRGTTFEAILDKINISLVYNDSSTEALDKDLCTFTHQYSSSTLASYEVKVTYENFECTFKINVVEEVDVYEIIDDTVTILEDILDDMGEYDGVVYGITKGLSDNSKVLVIPVEFTDYKADSQMQSVLEKAFFGTSEETGWESLKSYYYKSSYGKCNISGTVLPVFSTGKKSTYYDSLDDDAAVNSIIKAALEYYDNSINYDEYDTDGDKYIDSIYLIYTAPVDYESDDSLYWAFSYQYFTDDYEYYDNVEADYYCFMGYDFIFETLANGKKVTYNAETIIHESGHLFGLDDYYDYDDSKGPKGGIGGGDMMDYNVGDHNPFSKLILGWASPKVIDASNINSDITVDLQSFGQTGECLVIVNGWENSYFDEYFVIDFYTPDGLNALEAGYSGLFSVSGIRIYHIDATLNSPSNVASVWEVYKSNNTDTSHKLIKLIQADGLNEIENKNEYSDNEDLFQVNDKFTNIKWYDNSNCKFEIIVNSINGANAQITIKYIG